MDKKKKSKADLYKSMKGRATSKHSTKIIPNKKKSNKQTMVIQFEDGSFSSE